VISCADALTRARRSPRARPEMAANEHRATSTNRRATSNERRRVVGSIEAMLTYDHLTFPISIQRLLDDFDAVEQDASRLIGDLDDRTYNLAPAPGAWSAAQCLDHLAMTSRTYVAAMDAALAPAAPRTNSAVQVAPGAPSRWFVRQLEPPVRRKVKAPKIVAPAASRRRDEGWRDFVAANDSYREFAHRCEQIDVNRIRFRNPFAPVRFTIGTGLVLMVAHHRRHVWQMERAIAAASVSSGGHPAGVA
jgi:hypothetical protein